jgi:AcrR family transcriptional regulator
MADVAAASGVSRATLYRYYPSREALLEALAAQALTDAGSRIADAGLDRCPVPEAIERIVRALLAVGDRYAVLLSEQVDPDPAEAERVVGTPSGPSSPAGSTRASCATTSRPRSCSSCSAACSPPPSSSSVSAGWARRDRRRYHRALPRRRAIAPAEPRRHRRADVSCRPRRTPSHRNSGDATSRSSFTARHARAARAGPGRTPIRRRIDGPGSYGRVAQHRA